jgi:hypothetical protein
LLEACALIDGISDALGRDAAPAQP